MQNLNIAVNDRVWPNFDVGRMSNRGTGYIPKLKPIYETDLTTCGFAQFGLSEYEFT